MRSLPRVAIRRLRHPRINLVVVHLPIVYLMIIYLATISAAGRVSDISGRVRASVAHVATGMAGG
jgi:hypothetical protein